MIRMVLTDAQWEKMAPHCLGKVTDAGRSGKDNRLFVEAVLWKARTNSPWRDLPEGFGDWNAIFKTTGCRLTLVTAGRLRAHIRGGFR